MLDNAVPKDDESFVMLEDRILFIIGSIITLRTPLCVSLESMADREGSEIEAALEFLRSVVIVSPSDSLNEPLRVFHKSFVDFLTDRKRCVDPNTTGMRFFIDTPDHEAFLTRRFIEGKHSKGRGSDSRE